LKTKIPKSEVVKVMAELKKKYSNEELAVMISKTTQSIWRWSSPINKSVPDLANYELLKRLTVN
jgi:flavoprotein